MLKLAKYGYLFRIDRRIFPPILPIMPTKLHILPMFFRAMLPAVCLAVALMLPVAAAQAAPVSVAKASKQVRAGGKATFVLRVNAPAQRCRLRLSRGLIARSSATRKATRQYIAWTWSTPRSARSGVWKMQSRCIKAGRVVTSTRRLRVRGTRSGPLLVAGKIRSRLSGSRLQSSSPSIDEPTYEEPTAGERPTSGQCTDWAWYKRPELDNIYSDAHGWDDEARSMGFLVDGTPRVGDIAVYNEGTQGAGATGHVAYVEAVAADGTLHLSELNVRGDERYGERTGASPADLQFIHKK